jgi:SAM-dependent methyltransferase
VRHPSFLACPECRSTDLTWADDLEALPAPFDSTEGLRCDCGRSFPYVEGVWVLWSDEAKEVSFEMPDEDADLSRQVKAANIKIYGDVAAAYEEHADGLMSYREQLLFLKAIAADYAEAADEKRSRVMVDVGCGPGVGLEAGSGLFDQVVGCDISLSNLRAVAREGYVAVLGDAEKLPFKTGSIDVIGCFGAMHHFPNAEGFMRSGHDCLRPGGALVTGCDPCKSSMTFGPIARVVWELRKPVYRALSSQSDRFYLHKDVEHQRINDLAEYARTEGGFAPEDLTAMLDAAGFRQFDVFHGVDSKKTQRFAMPGWRHLVLQSLSFRNPLLRRNWVNLSSVARKGA